MPLYNIDLKDFMSDTFVETGTWRGDGIKQALSSGFKTVHSMDLPSGRLDNTKKAFSADKRVTIHTGASIDILPTLLRDLSSGVTFWLDAHPTGYLTVHKGHNKLGYAPLLEELDIIRAACVSDATILIDDLRLFPVKDVSLLEEKLRSMGASKIYRVDGVTPGDIMVGEI